MTERTHNQSLIAGGQGAAAAPGPLRDRAGHAVRAATGSPAASTAVPTAPGKRSPPPRLLPEGWAVHALGGSGTQGPGSTAGVPTASLGVEGGALDKAAPHPAVSPVSDRDPRSRRAPHGWAGPPPGALPGAAPRRWLTRIRQATVSSPGDNVAKPSAAVQARRVPGFSSRAPPPVLPCPVPGKTGACPRDPGKLLPKMCLPQAHKRAPASPAPSAVRVPPPSTAPSAPHTSGTGSQGDRATNSNAHRTAWERPLSSGTKSRHRAVRAAPCESLWPVPTAGRG